MENLDKRAYEIIKKFGQDHTSSEVSSPHPSLVQLGLVLQLIEFEVSPILALPDARIYLDYLYKLLGLLARSLILQLNYESVDNILRDNPSCSYNQSIYLALKLYYKQLALAAVMDVDKLKLLATYQSAVDTLIIVMDWLAAIQLSMAQKRVVENGKLGDSLGAEIYF